MGWFAGRRKCSWSAVRALIGWIAGMTLSLTTSQASAVVVTVDVPSAYNTLVLTDSNGTGWEHTGLSANATTPPGVPIWSGTSGGVANYTVPAGSSDPRWEFFNTVAYDVNNYGYLRVRMASDNTTKIQAWPNSPVTPTTVTLGSGSGSSTTFNEYRAAWVNPADASIRTATNGGFRIDMVERNALLSDITASLDYVMVDTSLTVGFEFDRDADLQGCTLTNVASWSVADGILAGTLNTSGSLDATITVPVSSLNLDTNVFDYVEIRMSQSAGSISEIYFGTSTQGGLSEARKVSFGIADGQFHTYIFDFSDDARWDGTLTAFRLDAANNKAGATFQIDYIRFRDFAYTPEPGACVLWLLGFLGIGLASRGRVRRS